MIGYRKFSWALPCSLAISLLWAILSCNPQTAGTSSGTENPEIVLSFSENNTSTLANGELQLFASSQNIIIDPEPLARFAVSNDSELVISIDSMENILESSQLIPLEEESLSSSFNFVFRENQRGGFVGGLTFSKGKGHIERNGLTLDVLEIPLKMTDIYNGELILNEPWEDPIFIYIPGTDVKSNVESNNFEVDGLVELDSARIMMRSGKIFKVVEPKITGDSLVVDNLSYEDSVDIRDLGYAPTISRFTMLQDTVTAPVVLNSPCELVDYPKYLLDYIPTERIDPQRPGSFSDTGTVTWDAILWKLDIRGYDFFLDFSSSDGGMPIRVFYEFVPPQPICRITQFAENVIMDSAYVIHPQSFENLGKINFTGLVIDTLRSSFYSVEDTTSLPGRISSPPANWPPPFATKMETWDWVEGDSIRSDTLYFP